jgi:hypothetical protein
VQRLQRLSLEDLREHRELEYLRTVGGGRQAKPSKRRRPNHRLRKRAKERWAKLQQVA